jgi:hypothetical protein
MFCRLLSLMMASGWFLGRKIAACSSGIREQRLCSVCCRDIRILVCLLLVFLPGPGDVDFGLVVISIDLSPAGNILATGSGDWQARICALFLSGCRSCLARSDVSCLCYRELWPSLDRWCYGTDVSMLCLVLPSCLSFHFFIAPCTSHGSVLSFLTFALPLSSAECITCSRRFLACSPSLSLCLMNQYRTTHPTCQLLESPLGGPLQMVSTCGFTNSSTNHFTTSQLYKFGFWF